MSIRGYKYRIYPNAEVRDLLARSFGCSRFVWNQLLDSVIKQYDLHKENPDTCPKPKVSQHDLVKLLPKLKLEYPWLSEVSASMLQQKARDLGTAFSNFFSKRSGYPKFKKRSYKQSIRLVKKEFTLKDGYLYISKLRDIPIKVKWSRELPSEPSSITISQESNGQYFVSFVCEYQAVPTNGIVRIGIDLGLSNFLTLSTGETIANPKYYVKSQKRLRKLQKGLARKQKGSNNHHKARLKVARCYAKTKRQRHDFLHKLSRSLVNQSKIIAIEDLHVKGLIRNRHLSKAISDVGWGLFTRYIAYKVNDSQHCNLVIANRFYPSTNTCSSCNHRLTKDQKLKLAKRFWECPHCNTQHNRDTNAGLNLIQMADMQLQLHPASPGAIVLQSHEMDVAA